jgi:hypothetical protein
MTPIPPAVKAEILADPYYKTCARADEGTCEGRVTWEHAYIYAGKQVQEKWSIIPLCVYHHLGAGLDKDLNHLIALLRADLNDLCARMPKKDWKRELIYLESLYEKVL